MSWDVFIQELPPQARSVRDVPDDFQPPPLGSREEVVDRVHAVYPDADFGADPSWGRLQRDGFAIDIALNVSDDLVSGVTLHVRGSDDAVPAVVRLIEAVGGRAVDSWTGELFDQAVAVHSIRRWRSYLEEI